MTICMVHRDEDMKWNIKFEYEDILPLPCLQQIDIYTRCDITEYKKNLHFTVFFLLKWNKFKFPNNTLPFKFDRMKVLTTTSNKDVFNKYRPFL